MKQKSQQNSKRRYKKQIKYKSRDLCTDHRVSKRKLYQQGGCMIDGDLTKNINYDQDKIHISEHSSTNEGNYFQPCRENKFNDSGNFHIKYVDSKYQEYHIYKKFECNCDNLNEEEYDKLTNQNSKPQFCNWTDNVNNVIVKKKGSDETIDYNFFYNNILDNYNKQYIKSFIQDYKDLHDMKFDKNSIEFKYQKTDNPINHIKWGEKPKASNPKASKSSNKGPLHSVTKTGQTKKQSQSHKDKKAKKDKLTRTVQKDGRKPFTFTLVGYSIGPSFGIINKTVYPIHFDRNKKKFYYNSNV